MGDRDSPSEFANVCGSTFSCLSVCLSVCLHAEMKGETTAADVKGGQENDAKGERGAKEAPQNNEEKDIVDNKG